MAPVNTGINPFAVYNTGYTGGMNSGTTYSSTLSQGARGGGSSGTMVMGGANISVGVLVALALGVLIAQHLLGFRFGFDVAVGRRG